MFRRSSLPYDQKVPAKPMSAGARFAILFYIVLGLGLCLWWSKTSATESENATAQLFQQSKLAYVDSEINEKNFPDVGIRTDFKIYQFERDIASEDAIVQMEKDGYQPANLRELLAWSRTNWDGKDWVVAPGQTYRNRFLCLGSSLFGKRKLELAGVSGQWKDGCRFLAVRK